MLQASGAVQEDTLVMAAAKGPSLLKEVMQMHESHRASPSVRYLLRDASLHSDLRYSFAHLWRMLLRQSSAGCTSSRQSVLDRLAWHYWTT